MKKTEIERILKQGSVRQKIKLYMTNIALCNVDLNNVKFAYIDGELDITGTSLLTAKESDLLWSSIKDPKDVEYYNELRKWNASFLLWKEKLTIVNMALMAIFLDFNSKFQQSYANDNNALLINDLLDIYPDKKSRDRALKKILEHTNDLEDWEGISYKYKKATYIRIDSDEYTKKLKESIKTVNALSKKSKDYIYTFKVILSKNLPLQPYKDWLKLEEGRLTRTLTNISKIPGASYLNGLIKYEDIDVGVTEEDIEDFKSAGV